MTAVDFQLSIIICVLFVIVALVFAGFWQHEYEIALKERNRWCDKYYRAEQEGMDEHEALVRMRYKYFALQKDYAELKYQLYQYQLKPHIAANQDLLDAVKKGMVAAHPDKGGKQEDFIRFNKVYNELRGRAN